MKIMKNIYIDIVEYSINLHTALDMGQRNIACNIGRKNIFLYWHLEYCKRRWLQIYEFTKIDVGRLLIQ